MTVPVYRTVPECTGTVWGQKRESVPYRTPFLRKGTAVRSMYKIFSTVILGAWDHLKSGRFPY